MELKFQQRMKEMSEGYNSQMQELNQKIKQLEREKATLNERLELSSRDTISEVANLGKKLDKQVELSERLQEELDLVKQERDKKLSEY
jgi:exonuclease VII small subunit